ncbi:MAG TPA: hypothetical protein VGJ29_02720, partial [Vicinamibacterales bacterium]
CHKSGTQTARTDTTSASAPAPTAAPSMPQSVTLTGCLQEGKGNTYVITELNEPKQPDSSQPAVVERERLAAAEKSYRLKSDDTAGMAKLVGHRVRVEGTLTRRANLPESPSGSVATSGQRDDRKAESTPQDISQKDLAQVDVRSVQSIANACGGRAGKSRSHAKTSSRSKR